MEESTSLARDSQIDGFFDAVTRKQSYLNIVYLLLSFPLGVFYFVFLITGLSVGISLLIVWIGIPILLLMLAASWGLTAFERQLAIWLLHANLSPTTRESIPWQHPWARLKAHLSNPSTWKGMLYLLVKFPFGILSFVVSITLISLTLTLVTAPITYQFIPLSVAFWQVDTFEKAIICSILGMGVGLLSIHMMNGLAFVWRRFAGLMLGAAQSAKEEPTINRPVFIP